MPKQGKPIWVTSDGMEVSFWKRRPKKVLKWGMYHHHSFHVWKGDHEITRMDYDDFRRLFGWKMRDWTCKRVCLQAKGVQA